MNNQLKGANIQPNMLGNAKEGLIEQPKAEKHAHQLKHV